MIAYSEPPLRNMVREIVTSAYSIGSAPSELSMVSTTSARPSGARPEVPAKMTSSILPPRSDLAPCSPMTQARPSTTFDFPDPFGPTMQVIPGSKCIVVADANDLNPRSVMLLRYKAKLPTRYVSAQTIPTPGGPPALTTHVSTAETRVGRRRWFRMMRVRQTDA